MNRLRLSFILCTPCDPSTVLGVLQQFAPDIARALETHCDEEDLDDDEAAERLYAADRADEEMDNSACVETLPRREEA